MTTAATQTLPLTGHSMLPTGRTRHTHCHGKSREPGPRDLYKDEATTFMVVSYGSHESYQKGVLSLSPP
jgi:hypothetical protein